jgi:Bacterial low temperature requirement A protein (LtrA)
MTSTSDESDLKGAAAAPAAPVSPSPPNEKAQEQHTHQLNSHHAHHHGARLLEFVHPHTGRTTHVVHTPEDLEKKRRELTRQSVDAKESLEDFDLVLHGSPEHHEAIRDLHSHHQNEHEKLKEEHPHVFEKFEHIRNELDMLNAELHTLTDHSVALDASFDKFGYSAHLRTKDDSETSSLKSDSTAKEKHQDRTANPLKFFKRPVVRQYFHKGLLWRSARSGEVPSFELFIDLVYVGVIDIIGEKAVEHPGGLSLLHFVIVFSIGWKIWADMTNVINWFDIDDIFQRICVAFYLICLFGFCTNIFYMFEEEETTYKSAVGFYIAQRLFLGLWYMMVARLVPMIRGILY